MTETKTTREVENLPFMDATQTPEFGARLAIASSVSYGVNSARAARSRRVARGYTVHIDRRKDPQRKASRVKTYKLTPEELEEVLETLEKRVNR